MIDDGTRYIVMWSDRGLEQVIDYDLSERRHLVRLLTDDPAAKLTSNPVRDMIVHAVIDGTRSYEIWEVSSEMTEEELLLEFENSPTTVQDEIRSVGILIYNTVGRMK